MYIKIGDVPVRHSYTKSQAIKLLCMYFLSFQDHKLKALYYGAERGLVTQMTVVDNKV